MRRRGILKQIMPTIVLMFRLMGVLYLQQLVFPAAEGYGKYTVGGPGDTVYEVTTHIHVRTNPAVETDAIGGRHKKSIILDHAFAFDSPEARAMKSPSPFFIP